MAKFKLSEAAKLVGINRRTIYKHIESGKVSATLDDMGNRCIEAAELHQAYGDFETKGTALITQIGCPCFHTLEDAGFPFYTQLFFRCTLNPGYCLNCGF